MDRCKCGSYAINPRLHGRNPNTDLDLCDVCYFKKRLEEAEQRIADVEEELDELEKAKGLIAELEQQLAEAETKIPRWIPVGESMPAIAEPYVEYGEWVLGKERYYKVPTICCRTWIDKEQNYWEWTAENGEVIDITHWMVIPNTLDAATDAPVNESGDA